MEWRREKGREKRKDNKEVKVVRRWSREEIGRRNEEIEEKG